MATFKVQTTEIIVKTFMVWALDEKEAVQNATEIAKDIHTDQDKYTVNVEIVKKIGLV